MKKKIMSVIILIIILLGYNSIIYAADTNITFSKNKDSYNAGDIIQISVGANNITLENGIETVIGNINYNKSLYESCTVEEKNGWKADFNEENGKIILQRNNGMKENGEIFVIKLKLKDNITTPDTISFTNINISDENTDLYPGEVKVEISITENQTEQKQEEEQQQQQEEQQQKKEENAEKQKEETGDITQKKNAVLPNTGKRMNIIFFVISILSILSCVFIYNYLKNRK